MENCDNHLEIITSPIDLTLLLSEIQEQQSLMKMYEITMMKLETEIHSKNSATLLLNKQAQESHLHNSSLEKIINSKPLYSKWFCSTIELCSEVYYKLHEDINCGNGVCKLEYRRCSEIYSASRGTSQTPHMLHIWIICVSGDVRWI